MKRERFHLVVVLWGRWHTERFLRFCIPSLLAPKNVPAASQRAKLHLTILTTAAEQTVISAAPSIVQMRRFIPVEVQVMPGGIPKGIERHLSIWRVMHEACRQTGEILMVLHPDVVCGDGTVTRMIQAFDDPRVAVSAKAMTRVLCEELEPLLDGMKSPDGVLTVPGPELARLSMAHMHHYSAATHQGSHIFRPTWEGLFVGPGGFAHSCASFEISALDPRAADATSHFTLYGNTRPEIDIITDVSEGFSISLTPFNKSLELLSAANWDPAFEATKGAAQELLRPVADPGLDEHAFTFTGEAGQGLTETAYAGEARRGFFQPVRNYWRLMELRDLLNRHDGMDATAMQLCIVNFSALKRLKPDRPLVLYFPAFSIAAPLLESMVGKPGREIRKSLWRQVGRFFGSLDRAGGASPGRLLNGTSFTFADDRLTWADGRVEPVTVERTRLGDVLLSKRAA
jgi:hypothetical protein